MYKSYVQLLLKYSVNSVKVEQILVRSLTLVVSKKAYQPIYVKPICKQKPNSLLSSCERNISKTLLRRNSQQTASVTNEETSENTVTGSSEEKASTTDKEDDSDTSTDLFDGIDYDEITGGDEDSLNQFKLLLLEVDVLRQDGMKVPRKLTTEKWKDLFLLKTRSQRQKLLKFLWTNEMKKLSDKRKKDAKRLAYEKGYPEYIKERESTNHITYGFQGSTIFLRVYDSSINHYDNQRLIQAMRFGQNIVVDCGYDANMNNMENKLCAKQLCLLFAENRLHSDPFNIHFCNMNKSSELYHHLKKHIPTLEDIDFPLNLSEDHYTKLFPKEKLVYLTPHCRTELKEFNHDDVYIIGALVDKSNSEPLSLAKAKSEGIRMAQLPLDRYLDWNIGTKSLTIDQVLKILLDAQKTKDWSVALKHVPRRKLRQPGEPKRDLRSLRLRGTIFQPPLGYKRS